LSNRVRELLEGAGELPDRRVAVDALDALRSAAVGLSERRRRAMFAELLELFGDADPVVHTGAVLGLDAVRQAWDADRLVDALDANGAALAVAPTGFAGANHRHLADEVLCRAAEVVRADRPALARIVDAVADPDLRPWLVANLAGSVPEVVVANAATWGRVGETGPLFRLRAHRHRCAFADALAPWPADSVARVRSGPWPPDETAALVDVMERRSA
jgi:hypothetical protein